MSGKHLSSQSFSDFLFAVFDQDMPFFNTFELLPVDFDMSYDVFEDKVNKAKQLTLYRRLEIAFFERICSQPLVYYKNTATACNEFINALSFSSRVPTRYYGSEADGYAGDRRFKVDGYTRQQFQSYREACLYDLEHELLYNNKSGRLFDENSDELPESIRRLSFKILCTPNLEGEVKRHLVSLMKASIIEPFGTNRLACGLMTLASYVTDQDAIAIFGSQTGISPSSIDAYCGLILLGELARENPSIAICKIPWEFSDQDKKQFLVEWDAFSEGLRFAR